MVTCNIKNWAESDKYKQTLTALNHDITKQ